MVIKNIARKITENNLNGLSGWRFWFTKKVRKSNFAHEIGARNFFAADKRLSFGCAGALLTNRHIITGSMELIVDAY